MGIGVSGEGYYVGTEGKNTKKIAGYIQNQFKEDELHALCRRLFTSEK